jgi:hypothetical protein
MPTPPMTSFASRTVSFRAFVAFLAGLPSRWARGGEPVAACDAREALQVDQAAARPILRCLVTGGDPRA